MSEKRISRTLRLENGLDKKVVAAAKADGRSINGFMTRALEKAVKTSK